MFGLFSKSKITPKLEGPFGVLIGEQAIKYFGLTPVGSHEGIDEHSFNTLTVPKPHVMFDTGRNGLARHLRYTLKTAWSG